MRIVLSLKIPQSAALYKQQTSNTSKCFILLPEFTQWDTVNFIDLELWKSTSIEIDSLYPINELIHPKLPLKLFIVYLFITHTLMRIKNTFCYNLLITYTVLRAGIHYRVNFAHIYILCPLIICIFLVYPTS